MANSDKKTSNLLKMEESTVKLEDILLCLKKNFVTCIRKAELQSRIKNYKKDFETRANELKAEVNLLREELKTIRNLLGLKLQNNNSFKS